ncbi:type II toxin-antitoxin system RelE family toxin [Pseudactinotalea sp. Z1732]|uniref:type II toxin-antitoxin system RelE family toxin n=1 Tax=Micrococcales TaxID=85006 RepID=UPI003C7E5909
MSPGSPGFEIVFDARARKELRRLDKPVGRRVYRAIMALADDPRPADVRQLRGHPGLWRIRIGAYRVVYAIDNDQLIVVMLRVAHRREAYRNL